MYKQKYQKYRAKYLNLKDELSGGVGLGDVPEDLLPKMVSDNSMTCRQTMNTAKTSKAFANAIDFPNLTNNIRTNIPNIYNRSTGICNQIDDVVRRDQCNEYNNKCYIFELFAKYSNIRYQGQILVAPVPPAPYDLNTLNQILLRTIPNNTPDPDKSIDQQNLIRFGANIVHIYNYAFHDNQLTDVRIPSTIRTIGDGAFLDNRLVQLTIPDSVRTIGAGAFRNNRLVELRISNSVETISESAFLDNRLVQITIPNTVRTIGKDAFSQNQLRKVTLPRRFIDRIIEIFGNITNIIFTYTD
jgi:hypothetical protein